MSSRTRLREWFPRVRCSTSTRTVSSLSLSLSRSLASLAHVLLSLCCSWIDTPQQKWDGTLRMGGKGEATAAPTAATSFGVVGGSLAPGMYLATGASPASGVRPVSPARASPQQSLSVAGPPPTYATQTRNVSPGSGNGLSFEPSIDSNACVWQVVCLIRLPRHPQRLFG